MFKKILIAEDIDSIQNSVISQVKQLTDATVHHAKYCDEAYLKIKKAVFDAAPYDLLITDLSFTKDHRDVDLESGEDLIKAVRELKLDIKIIGYSIEDKSYVIKHLFENYNINGYVSKGRNGSAELEKAILSLAEKEDDYIDTKLLHVFRTSKIIEIEESDIQLLKYLSRGFSQDEIEEKLKNIGGVPSSKSTIEKRINKLKAHFKAKNNAHLVNNAKDLGLI